jgi:hypothetical protein
MENFLTVLGLMGGAGGFTQGWLRRPGPRAVDQLGQGRPIVERRGSGGWDMTPLGECACPKALIALAAALLALGRAPFPQAQAEVRTVQAEGYGSIIGGDTAQARDEAIIDARVRALEQVAGVFVDARTLVENEMLLDSMVRDRTQGLVTSYRVLKEGPTGDGRYRVVVEARVSPEDVKEKLQGLSSDFAIVVMVQETNLGRPHGPPIVENSIITKLVEAGYRVADPGQVLKVRERDRMKALLENDLDAIKAIAGRFLANLLVMGRALSEPSQVTQGILSARARVSVRVVEAETGRILVNREMGDIRGFDLAQDRAGQKALRAAGEAITEYLLEQLDQHFKRKERTVEVRVRGLASVEELQAFKNLLQSLRWVSDIQEKVYDPKESLVVLRYPEKTLYLAGRIGRERGYRVVYFDRTRIVIDARRP